MFSWLGRWHLLKQIFANNEPCWCEKSNNSDPNGIGTNTSIIVNDANFLVVLVLKKRQIISNQKINWSCSILIHLSITIWANRTKDDDREDLKVLLHNKKARNYRFFLRKKFQLHLRKIIKVLKSRRVWRFLTQQTALIMMGGRWTKAIAGIKQIQSQILHLNFTFIAIDSFIKWMLLTYGRIFLQPCQLHRTHPLVYHQSQNPLQIHLCFAFCSF